MLDPITNFVKDYTASERLHLCISYNFINLSVLGAFSYQSSWPDRSMKLYAIILFRFVYALFQVLLKFIARYFEVAVFFFQTLRT